MVNLIISAALVCTVSALVSVIRLIFVKTKYELNKTIGYLKHK